MIRNALLALALASFTPVLAAQSTQADLQARLVHRPLYLLGRWRDDHLKFDNAGRLLSKSDVASFTVSGIDVEIVELTAKGLTIRGFRSGLVFRGEEVQRISLGKGNPPSGTGESILVQIAPSPTGDYKSSLDAIFTDNLAAFSASMPDYWQTYAATHLIHPQMEIAASEDKDGPPLPGEVPPVTKSTPGVRRVGGGVLPPKVLSMPEPQHSREARSAQISGNALVYLQVDTAGMPSHVRLLRPLGLGLDEKAVEAVSRYKFKPSSQNGLPVAVEMNLEFTFQIF